MAKAKPESKRSQKDVHQPTSDEEQEREDFAYELLSRCLHKSQIKQQFYKRYEAIGGMSARTVEKYLSRARDRMRLAASAAADDLRAESLAFYLSMVRSAEATVGEKVRARERIDKLFGLDAASKIEHSGKIDVSKYTDEELAAIAAGEIASNGGA